MSLAHSNPTAWTRVADIDNVPAISFAVVLPFMPPTMLPLPPPPLEAIAPVDWLDTAPHGIAAVDVGDVPNVLRCHDISLGLMPAQAW